MNPIQGDVPKGTITAIVAFLTAVGPGVFGVYQDMPLSVQERLAISIPIALGVIGSVYIYSHVRYLMQKRQNEVSELMIANTPKK